MGIATTSRDVLLVVDLQNDFLPGVTQAVSGGDAVIPMANRLAASFAYVVLTQDWHPAGHRSFASSLPGRAPFDVVALDYGPQLLWPDGSLAFSARSRTCLTAAHMATASHLAETDNAIGRRKQCWQGEA